MRNINIETSGEVEASGPVKFEINEDSLFDDDEIVQTNDDTDAWLAISPPKTLLGQSKEGFMSFEDSFSELLALCSIPEPPDSTFSLSKKDKSLENGNCSSSSTDSLPIIESCSNGIKNVSNNSTENQNCSSSPDNSSRIKNCTAEFRNEGNESTENDKYSSSSTDSSPRIKKIPTDILNCSSKTKNKVIKTSSTSNGSLDKNSDSSTANGLSSTVNDTSSTVNGPLSTANGPLSTANSPSSTANDPSSTANGHINHNSTPLTFVPLDDSAEYLASLKKKLAKVQGKTKISRKSERARMIEDLAKSKVLHASSLLKNKEQTSDLGDEHSENSENKTQNGPNSNGEISLSTCVDPQGISGILARKLIPQGVACSQEELIALLRQDILSNATEQMVTENKPIKKNKDD